MKMVKSSKGLVKRQNIQIMVANLSIVSHKINECLYHIIIMHLQNMILKRIKANSRDVLIEQIHEKKMWDSK